MIFSKRAISLSLGVMCAAVVFSGNFSAQTRARVVKPVSSQAINAPAPPPAEKKSQARPPMMDNIVVVKSPQAAPSLVKRTGASAPTNSAGYRTTSRSTYSVDISTKLDQAIRSRYGIRYRYGSSGPNTYDCSGFVWSVFQEAGIPFTRASARSLWAQSEPVSGDDRFKYGTLVFLNGLGHMGIVADEFGFFHASSSKGITYSPFAGYWGKRIVGFRRLGAIGNVTPDILETDER